MKRITGNWFRKHDPKERVESIWPNLEEALEKMGLSFSSGNCVPFPDIFEYNSKLPYQREKSEIMNDLSRSRQGFVQNIGRFGYHRLPLSSTVQGWTIAESIYVPAIYLSYTGQDKNNHISFHLLPGRYKGNHLYVGVRSTPKSLKRNDEQVEKMIYASNLTVIIASDPETEREVSKIYQRLKTP